MAHYAFIDDNNIVTEIIVGIDETELIDGIDPEIWYSQWKGQTCKRTSYNGKIRKNYAGVGYTYNADLDAFIPPRPDKATGLDENTCRWIIPIEDLHENAPK